MTPSEPRRLRSEFPLPATRTELLRLLRTALTRNVCLLHVEAAQPVRVEWIGVPGDVIDPADDLSLEQLLKRIRVEEIPETSAKAALGAATTLLDRESLVCSHALVAPHTVLHTWLGVDVNHARPKLASCVAGGSITQIDGLDDRTLLLIGAEDRIMPLSSARVGLRIDMEVPT